MPRLLDMGGFAKVGAPILALPRYMRPFAIHRRVDYLTALGGESIMVLDSVPCVTSGTPLNVHKNGSLLFYGTDYTVTANFITLATAAGTGNNFVVDYSSDRQPRAATYFIPGVTDPLFADVFALLHFQGADNSATFNDVIGNTWAVTGAPLIKNTVGIFGATSGYFPSGYISMADAAGNRLGTQDFDIAWQQNIYSISSYQTMWRKGYVGSGDITYQTDNSNGRGILYFSGSAIAVESTGTINANQTYYLRARRVGTAVFLERNGTVVATGTSSANLNGTGDWFIGADPSGSSYPSHAYIGEFRGTLGNARAAGGLQTAPWPDM